MEEDFEMRLMNKYPSLFYKNELEALARSAFLA